MRKLSTEEGKEERKEGKKRPANTLTPKKVAVAAAVFLTLVGTPLAASLL
jgi:hypothetical protein